MASFERSGYAYNIIRKAAVTPDVSIMLLAGDTITLSEAMSSVKDMDSEAEYYSASLLENLEALNSRIVYVSRYPGATSVEALVWDKKLKLKFNTIQPEYTSTIAGETYPTSVLQAIIAFHSGSAELSGGKYDLFALCSVGAPGSGADLELSTLNIDSDMTVHFSDLILKF